MKHVFLDTNILVDYVFKERPYHEFALLIFRTVKSQKIVGYTSTQSLMDLVYIYTKGNKHRIRETGSLIHKICDSLIVCDTLKHHLSLVIANYYDDLEDAVQTAKAIDNYCDVIVSGNRNFDGSFGPPVVSPDEFCRDYFEE